MSRSYKLPIIKDKPRNYKRTPAYWRPIRRIWKHTIRNSITPSYWDMLDSPEIVFIGKEDMTLEEKDAYIMKFEASIPDDEIDFPNPKTIINDYDYCDYIWDWRYTGWIHLTEEELKEKIKQLSRK